MLKTLVPAALAGMLALSFGAASPALAVIVKHTKSPTGDHVYTYRNDDGDIQSIHVYDKDHNHLWSFYNDSNPSPDGDGSSGGAMSSNDVKEALEKLMGNGGGALEVEKDFLETPVGKQLVESGKTGSIVPFHNPADALATDFEGYGGSAGGIDLNGGSIPDQIKNGKKNKSGDDDDDDTSSSSPGANDDELEWGGASASKELVNPVPVDKPAASAVKRFKKPAATTGRKARVLKYLGKGKATVRRKLPRRSLLAGKKQFGVMKAPVTNFKPVMRNRATTKFHAIPNLGSGAGLKLR